MTTKSKGSLTFPTDPLASMRELSDLNAAPEEMKERNNEGNFITSQLPIKQISEETLSEVRQKDRKQPAKSPSNVAQKLPAKQSLKEAVLENGGEREEEVKKTRLNVDIEEDLHVWLKGHAIQNRRKLNDLIPRILKAYRDEVEGEN